MKDIEKVLQLALTAGAEKLRSLAHHHSPQVITNILLNQNVTEEVVLLIAKRKNISPDVIELLYNDKRWKENYKFILALCKNPRTPQKISLSLLKSLRILDLADLTRNQSVPINIKLKAEENINEKIISLPLGIKISLARRASSAVLVRLIEDGMKEVVPVCLDSPYIIEPDICKIINRKKTASHVIRKIAEHPKWSSRYQVQWSLILNNHTPLVCVVEFLKKMRTTDLKELYALALTPASTRPFIYNELLERGGGN